MVFPDEVTSFSSLLSAIVFPSSFPEFLLFNGGIDDAKTSAMVFGVAAIFYGYFVFGSAAAA